MLRYGPVAVHHTPIANRIGSVNDARTGPAAASREANPGLKGSAAKVPRGAGDSIL